MKFSIFTSVMVALLGANTVAAVCCTGCGEVYNACVRECTAGGTDSVTCGRVCYGQGLGCAYSCDAGC